MSGLILFNANVITMDPMQPWADLVSIEGSQIKMAARREMLQSLRKRGTRAIDCAGRTLAPGFVDAHCHVHAYAESLVSLNLSPAGPVYSIATLQHKIRRFCQDCPPGTWIRGKGYDEFYLAEQRHPNRWDLDAASPLHPVKLTHRSGHAHVLNSLALKHIGITAETGDPPGGLIGRDLESGEPTGILYGMGGYLAERVPPLDNAEMERGAALANCKLLSYGITSAQDASFANDLNRWRQFVAWKTRGILQPRLTMMVGLRGFEELKPARYRSDIGEVHLKLGGVKIIADRVSGSLHPSRETLNERISAIHAAGRQAIIHAVEEPEITAACDAIEHALNQYPRQDPRHRIEHCSVCPPSLVRRLGKLGIAVVTQPCFIYYSGDRYMRSVHQNELKNLYPIASMLKNGLLAGSSSDFPIADPNPLVGICAAVTRGAEGGGRILPRQGISALDALRMYTLGAAAANFEEGIKGSISPGKLADLVLLSEDPLKVDADRIKDIRVVMTVLGGQIVWSDGSI